MCSVWVASPQKTLNVKSMQLNQGSQASSNVPVAVLSFPHFLSFYSTT